MFSVVVLTFNSIKFIKPCLDSLFSQSYKYFEVIIVDNGSIDGTIGFIRKIYPNVRIIPNKTNVGACKARNQGIEVAQKKWILTLDCDVILRKDFLFEMSQRLLNVPQQVGMVQPKIMNLNTQTIYSCGIFLSQIRRFYDIGQGEKDFGQFDQEGYIFGVCAAASLFRRKMLEEIKEDTGYFDERFFFLVEDVDLSWRAQKKGWGTLFFPEAVCSHLGNSSGFSKKIRQYLCFRNRYYTIAKNEGFKNYSKKVFALLFYDLPRLLYLVFTNPLMLKRKDMI